MDCKTQKANISYETANFCSLTCLPITFKIKLTAKREVVLQ